MKMQYSIAWMKKSDSVKNRAPEQSDYVKFQPKMMPIT